MDPVQNQILALNTKVDRLYEMIEHLNQRLLHVLETNESHRDSELEENRESAPSDLLITDSGENWGDFMHHKDVLGDESRPSPGKASPESNITPEVQIQRLTAQLTAAYNRIAALEEQLLSRTDFAQRNHQLISERRQ